MTDENKALDMYQGDSIVKSDEHVGAVSASVRYEQELKAALFHAAHNPRNEQKAVVAMTRTCQRASFAEKAIYSFPRGRGKVKGPSVNLAREMARCWGNIRYGLRIVGIDDEQVHIEGWGLDIETNVYISSEARFKKKIQRKNHNTGITEWIDPDERDLRELVNKHGAIAIRNCLLQLIPYDITEDLMKKVEIITKKAAHGDLKANREDTIRALTISFSRIGVSVDMLERYLGHAVADINAEEVKELREIFKSIDDGNSRREEHFSFNDKRYDREEADFDMNQVDGREAELPHKAKKKKSDSGELDLGGESVCKHGVPAGETCEKCAMEFGDSETAKAKAAKIVNIKKGIGIVGEDVYAGIMKTLVLAPGTSLRELDVETLDKIQPALNIAADNQD